jgi:hypothetical protein
VEAEENRYSGLPPDDGTDHRNGVSLDQQGGGAIGGWAGYGVPRAYVGVARHAAKCAE